jgi:large subunit ribosomal protein L9
MKVLLVRDVYKLGRAGDVKKVADGYGRNFLLTQGLAVLATPGALKQVDRLREKAAVQRAAQNDELSGIAEKLNGLAIAFAAKAGETGKLYGSITTQDIAEALEKKSGYPAKRQQVDMQPVRNLGEHVAHLRLTMDLIPEIKVVVYREGEADPTQPHAQAPAPVKTTPTDIAEPEPIGEVEADEETTPPSPSDAEWEAAAEASEEPDAEEPTEPPSPSEA